MLVLVMVQNLALAHPTDDEPTQDEQYEAGGVVSDRLER